MKRFVFLLLLTGPFQVWAQNQPLKPIEYRELATFIYRGTTSVQRQYSYDGVDIINPKRNLAPYLLALNDSATNEAYMQYVQIRQGKTVASVSGLLCVGIGLGIGSSYLHAIRQQQSVQFQSRQPFSTQNQPTFRDRGLVGLGFILLGGILCGVGSSSFKTNQSLHRAVQIYNRTLERRSISWHLTPFSRFSQSGISLTGQF